MRRDEMKAMWKTLTHRYILGVQTVILALEPILCHLQILLEYLK